MQEHVEFVLTRYIFLFICLPFSKAASAIMDQALANQPAEPRSGEKSEPTEQAEVNREGSSGEFLGED